LVTSSDFLNSIPLVIIASTSLVILIIEAIFPKDYRKKSEGVIFYISIAALAAAINFSFLDFNKNLFIYSNFLRVNATTAVLNITLLIGIFITVLSSRDYLESEGINYGEYYSLLFLSLLGMMIMVSSNDLLMIFIGLELMSVCFYVLAGFMRKKIESNESALKYFLLGAFLTGFLLLGIAFVYGYTGSTNFSTIASLQKTKESFYVLGLVLIFIAFLFKTGSFPLQMWIPDVYQGSPTIVAGMMSSVGKTAAFGALVTIFTVFEIRNIAILVAVISILTMLYGNVVALVQTNIKRLLAYSSIAHAGYIMTAFIFMNSVSSHAVLFYLVSYVLMQLGAFVIASVVEEKFIPGTADSVRNAIDSYRGLGRTNPVLASFLTIFLFSLAGIPPFAGFWGKYYVFLAAIQNNYLWVAIIGILLSLVGVYYYIRIILLMWFYEPAAVLAEPGKKDFAFTAAVISAIGLFLFGFYPELIFKYLRFVP